MSGWSLETKRDSYDLMNRLERLGLGPLLKNQDAKLLIRPIYELRPATSRILFTIRGGVAWLLRAFKKKSRKTPQHEIDLAKQRANYIP